MTSGNAPSSAASFARGTSDRAPHVPNDAIPRDWSATAAFVALVAGAAGGALERGWPSGNDPVAVAAFIAAHRPAILGQSALFLVSSMAYFWFFGSLRAFIAEREGAGARLASIVSSAGTAWIALGMVAQALQIGQTLAAPTGVEPSMMWTMAAVFAIANLPCAVMLAAVAVATLRYGVFARWLGALTIVASLAQLVLSAGAIVTAGPLAPNGWLTYVLYPLIVVWLVPTAVVLFRSRRPGCSRDTDTEVASAVEKH